MAKKPWACFCFNFYLVQPVLIQIFLDVFNSADMFVAAIGTTISSNLSRQHRQVLSLSFLDVYGRAITFALANGTTISSSLGMVQASVSLSFLNIYGGAIIHAVATGTTISNSLCSGTSQCSIYCFLISMVHTLATLLVKIFYNTDP
jgi:hypothetical protein